MDIIMNRLETVGRAKGGIMITELGPVADTSEHLVGVRGNAALRIEQSTAYRPPMLTKAQIDRRTDYLLNWGTLSVALALGLVGCLNVLGQFL